jgi:ATP-binding cassette subfamily F protein 3
MILLSVKGIRKHFGPEPVLSEIAFDVRSGERIGLVGPNGTGKTTLLKILAGEEEADAGSAAPHASVRVEYLRQQPILGQERTVWEEAQSALDELILLGREAEAVAGQLSEARDDGQRRRLASRYDHLQQELHRRDAYNLDHKIRRVLEGLGFPRQTFDLPTESLSGGERNRLMLAKLLLSQPDLMLLDEPSNHLDLESTEWLEDFLLESPAAMIVVSHDRYFLDKVTRRTLELFHGTIDGYSGSFSAYRRQKEERLLVQRRAYRKQQIEIEKAKEFIRRNRYGQKHAQAEDRRKKLERIEPVPPPREITEPRMGFPPATRTGDLVLRAEHLSKAYDRVLFDDLALEIARGERWAILGPNGSGKTTLLGCLVGRVAPDRGEVILGEGVRIGYFDQHLRGLGDESLVVDAIRPERRELDEPKRRDLLARFGVCGETALQKVGQLSGGERCRAALARLAAEEVNFLVLDEPTNHLDLWARSALERSLNRFDGTILFVSHDRYLINQVADHVLVVEPGRFRAIEGDYATYLHLVRQGSAGDTAGSQADDKPARPSKEPRKRAGYGEAVRKKRRFPYRKVEDLEKEIHQRETRLEELHALLADPATHRDGHQARQVKADIASEQERLETLFDHWEEAAELNW